MALKPRTKTDVPSSKTEPPKCRFKIGGKDECGAVARNTIKMTLVIMEKTVPVILPVCDDHIEEMENRATDQST